MYYIDYSLNTNYMIRNLLKAANALTFRTMFLLLLAGCNKNTIILKVEQPRTALRKRGPGKQHVGDLQRLRGGPEPITFHVSHE